MMKSSSGERHLSTGYVSWVRIWIVFLNFLQSGQCEAVITSNPQTFYVNAGDTRLLPCTVQGLMEGQTVKWLFVDHHVTISSGRTVLGDPDRYSIVQSQDSSSDWNLQIWDIEVEDTGLYMCKVDDATPAVEVTHHLKVQNGPIKPEPEPYDITDCCSNANVSMDCMVLCNPSANTIARVLDVIMNSDCLDRDIVSILECGNGYRNLLGCCMRQGLSGLCLELCTDQADRNGSYSQCQSPQISLAIYACYAEGMQLVPTPPTGVAVTTIDTGLLVSWQKPVENAEEVTMYKILYKTRSQSEYKVIRHPSTTNMFYPLIHLAPATTYQIQVIAVAPFGASLPSFTVEHATSSGGSQLEQMNGTIKDCCVSKGVSSKCQSYCISDFFLTGLNPDSISGCFGELRNIFTCLVGQRNHTPCCQRIGLADHCLGLCSGQHIPMDWNLTSVCMVSLPVIMACTMEGSRSLPSPPKNSRLGQVTWHTADVSWEAPDDNSADGYVVGWQYYNTTLKFYNTEQVYGKRYQIDSLRPTTMYQAGVLSQNENGTSLPDSIFDFLTEEQPSDSLPGPAYNETRCCEKRNFSAPCLPMCDHDFRMSADYMETVLGCLDQLVPMLECASEFRNHTVCCSQRGVSSTCLPLCVLGPNHNLVSGNELNYIGCASFVEEISLCYDSGTATLPRMPENLTLAVVTETFVMLNWKNPGGPAISEYVVESRQQLEASNWQQAGKTSATSYKVTGLKAATSYDFRVFGQNTKGKSLPSIIADVVTNAGPVDSNSSTKFNWTHLFESREECCRSSGLTVDCQTKCLQGRLNSEKCLVDADKILACSADGRNHTSCCQSVPNFPTSCLPYCSAQPPMRDVRSALCLPYMSFIFACFLKGADTLPSPPRNLGVISSSYESISLAWQVPVENCDLRDDCQFLLYYWQQGDEDFPNTNKTTRTSYLLTGLKPETSYRMTVLSQNRHGTSLPGSSLIFETNRDIYDIEVRQIRPRGIVDQGTASVLLDCRAEPTPRSIEWFRNKQLQSSSGELTVKNVDKDSAGNYTCKVTYSGQTREKQLTLNVKYKPVGTHMLEDSVVPGANLTAVLHCEFQGFPAAIEWKKGGHSITIGDKYVQKDQMYDLSAGLTSSSLMVHSVVSRDYDQYTCLGINNFGTGTISGKLSNPQHVTSPPTTGGSPNTTACCMDKGLPTVCVTKICLAGLSIDIQAIIGDYTLTECLNYLEELLSCAADGRDHTMCCVKEGVSDFCLPYCKGTLPDYEDELEQLQCLPYLDSLFACVEEGYDLIPSPPENVSANRTYDQLQVHWDPPAKNAFKVKTYEVFYQLGNNPPESHVLSNSYRQHSRSEILKKQVYTVWVEAGNDFGKSNMSNNVVLKINAVTPSAVVNFRGDLVGMTSIRLNWAPPLSTVSVITYSVNYSVIAPGMGEMYSGNTTDTTLRLDHLYPNVVYEIKVVPYSVDGPGQPSNKIDIPTHEAHIIKKPQTIDDSRQNKVGLAVGLTLSILFLGGIAVAAVFFFRRYKFQAKAAGTVAFENPHYGDTGDKVEISGLPEQPKPDPPQGKQFSYAPLDEDGGYTTITENRAASDRPDAAGNYDNPALNVYDNPATKERSSHYDMTGQDNPAIDLGDEGPATLHLDQQT